ncbi:MAG: DUF4115 domain-containing protein [Nocardioidaceae bacterium]|nr:DUF4115 domain-containing protein [Nocardioidaceae bacterium]
MNVVIRRRAGLMGLIAVAALAMAAAYLWRFSQTQGAVELLLGSVLGIVAIAHALAFGDARTPLLVADETGLRVRLGGDWIGLTWHQVERIEVDERGRVADGHVAVLAADLGEALDEATWRGRLGARFNRFAYDAPLVVPFGLTTSVSVVDVAGALTRLAAERAPVVALTAPADEPEPTVAVHDPTETAAEEATASGVESAAAVGADTAAQQGDHAGHPGVVEAGAPGFVTAALPSWADFEQTADPVDREDPEDPVDPEVDEGDVEEPVAPPAAPEQQPAGTRASVRRLPWGLPKLPRAGRRTDADAPPAGVAAARTSTPARREEVTMPVRREPATMGMLALSEPYAEADTEPLPEIRELRRRDEQQDGDARDDSRGNVGLIIDATTDLSARAMRKVRRPAPKATDEPAVVELDAEEQQRLLVGDALTQARKSLGLSVDELAERTRIRPFVIDSMEVDDFAPCGGDFYARGHLRMLGRVLGIDAEPLVRTYDERFAAQPINARAVFDVELSSGTTGMVRGGAPGANWGALIATVLVIVLIWAVAQYFAAKPAEQSGSHAPPQNSAGLGSPGPGNQPVAKEPPKTFVKVMARGGDSRVVVTGRADKVLFRGIITAGDSTRVVGIAPLRVMAVDGGVVALRVKGRQLGLMGESGQRAFQRISASR